MDNHFPDDMTYWHDKPSVVRKHERIANKRIYYKFVTYFDVWNFPEIDRYKKTTYYIFGYPVYRKVKKINP
jgi:hypothetical protein